MLSPICSENQNELNPLQEIIFSAQSSSSSLIVSEPKDVSKNGDKRATRDHCNKSNRTAKRQRSMEYRVMMEKKRRQLIRDKIDILQEMTPNCAKSDVAAKLESIVEYIKSLKHQLDIMSTTYTEPGRYMSTLYGAQTPYMSTYPWGYFSPGVPLPPYQSMPLTPRFYQIQENLPLDQTKP